MDCPPVELVSTTFPNPNYDTIGKYFDSRFGIPPFFFVRVPGRVNLIGEHIDYCGYNVLPMAIEQDIILAVRANETETLNLKNFESSKYPNFSTSVDDLDIDTSSPQWYDYLICGYRGIAEKYQLTNKGLDIVVKGTIPPSSGLSSSSALVCATALATAFANSITLTKMEMASLCATAEQYIGTEGGGMDQAIAFLAEPDTAKLIKFNPLRTFNVPLPENVVFVVCNSCVAMNKASSSQFNIRVVECRVAAKVLVKKNGLDWHGVRKLAEVPILLRKDITEMKAIIENVLAKKFYDRSELCSILDISIAEFNLLLSENTLDLKYFQLASRATHVFEEAARVRQFKQICETGSNEVLQLGRLMNESHKSCRDLYECSHPVLDDLVQTALDAGALGSRLTGAGWGGCCVSLVMKSQVEQFIQTMKTQFYDEREKYADFDLSSAMFITKPGSGAAVYIM